MRTHPWLIHGLWASAAVGAFLIGWADTVTDPTPDENETKLENSRSRARVGRSIAWTFGPGDRPETFASEMARVLAISDEESPLGKGYQITLFPIGSTIDAVKELRREVAILGLVSILIAGNIAFFFARQLSKPISALVDGTERVRKGDLDSEVLVRGKDEFGRLAGAFNAMTRDLALKEQYREVLGKVSDPAVARRLMEGEIELGGEVVPAAVLFCDIRGFTEMTDGMPPAQVIEMLNEHMTALTQLVHQHGGVVDKFVGDLVMALFGVPESQGDDPLRAARCAMDMIEKRRELDLESGRVIEVGIGLAYGELVAGCMGSNDRLNYTVLGDRVNLASRLCSAANSGEVLVDANIAAAARGEFSLVEHEPLSLKGFAQPVEAFTLGSR